MIVRPVAVALMALGLAACGSMPRVSMPSLPGIPGLPGRPGPKPAQPAGPPQTAIDPVPAPATTPPPPARPQPAPRASPGARENLFPARAPAPTPGMDWFFSATDDEALLIYGASRTSDLRFGMRCRRNEETIAVTQVVDRTRSDSVIFYSLNAMFVYPASLTDDPGGRLLTVELGRADEGLAAFKANGWISVDGTSGALVGHAPQAGTTAVADFFAWCR